MTEVAKPIEGKITSFGMKDGVFDGTLTIDVQQPGGAHIPTVVRGSEAQRAKMFPKLKENDIISVYVRPDGTIQGGITVKDKGKAEFVPGSSYAGEGPRPVSKYPTKTEQSIIESGEKQKSIMWMAALKNATEIEKFFIGGVEDRQETTKNILIVAYAIYHASLRVMRDLPPIEEASKP